MSQQWWSTKKKPASASQLPQKLQDEKITELGSNEEEESSEQEMVFQSFGQYRQTDEEDKFDNQLKLQKKQKVRVNSEVLSQGFTSQVFEKRVVQRTVTEHMKT